MAVFTFMFVRVSLVVLVLRGLIFLSSLARSILCHALVLHACWSLLDVYWLIGPSRLRSSEQVVALIFIFSGGLASKRFLERLLGEGILLVGFRWPDLLELRS